MELQEVLTMIRNFSKTEYRVTHDRMLKVLARNDWQAIQEKLQTDKDFPSVLAYHHALMDRKESEKIFADFCVLCHPNETMDYLFMMSEQKRLREAVRKARQLEESTLWTLYVAVYGRKQPSL